jgi:hypothetical protein
LAVNGAESVQDYLQQWQDENRNADTGTLAGTLTDGTTGAPLPDILVSAAGNLTFTDANGQFVLQDLSMGVHNVVF